MNNTQSNRKRKHSEISNDKNLFNNLMDIVQSNETKDNETTYQTDSNDLNKPNDLMIASKEVASTLNSLINRIK